MEPTDETSGTASPRLVSFVLPVFNEQASVGVLFQRIAEVMRQRPERFEALFVDDGSTDGSFDKLAELCRADARVRIVQLRRNFGKSAAYSAGFDHARGDTIITLDTDLQDDPEEIPLFLDKLAEGYDMVVGWKHEGKGPPGKSWPSKLFNLVVRWVTRIPLHDFNCPFKAYRKAVLGEIEVYGELHRYIPVLASARGFSLAEIKIKNLPRRFGSSHFGLERYVRGMLDLLTVVFITRFAKRPLHALAIAGLLAFSLGFGILALMLVGHVLHHSGVLLDPSWNLHDRPALSLSVLLMIVGAQFISLGLLGELFVTASAASANNKGYSIRKILER
jgi:glycosyltransferase involved in cell wall biosynthesis